MIRLQQAWDGVCPEETVSTCCYFLKISLARSRDHIQRALISPSGLFEVAGETKGPRKACTIPFIYFKLCFEHEPGPSSASGGRVKNLSLPTWNVTSFSSYFLLREILFADGAVTKASCTTLLLSRWIYCCRETSLLSRFGSKAHTHGMVLLKIHPVPRRTDSTSITPDRLACCCFL